jgi:two-component system, chemotaxis family, chemotaxis protein CheY
MKTLIAQDDFASALLLQRELAPLGDCHVAATGMEALDAFVGAVQTSAPYDLMCLDIILPDMDGQAVLTGIRAAEAAVGYPPGVGIRVIITTVLRDPGHIMSAFKEFCDAYLTKPIDTKKLHKYLREFGLGAPSANG